MRKFDDQASPAPAADPGNEVLRLDGAACAALRGDKLRKELRSLVRFAMGRGYYDAWNKPVESGVTACPDE